MAIDIDALNNQVGTDLDLSWMKVDTEWGVRGVPGRKGLTLDDVNIGSYGAVPEKSHNQTARPRGAARRIDAPRIGNPYSDKTDVWGDSMTLLYEEALARQWSSATDIPWETVVPQSDDMELAMCQLCTFLTEVEFIAGDLPGKWLPELSPDYYEVALFLATQIMDEARHLDVFRKRALVNGGGLMAGGPGGGNLLGGSDFTEMTALLHLVGEGFVQSLFRMGEYIGQNEAEKRIFRLAAADESRHVAFGVMHLKYVIETEPDEYRDLIHHYLDQFEGVLGTSQAGITTNPSTGESLAILMGGGIAKVDEGFKKLMVARKRQINEYMHRLEVIGLGDRRQRMNPAMQPFLDPPRN